MYIDQITNTGFLNQSLTIFAFESYMMHILVT